MPVYPFLPWHCYFSIALLRWTSLQNPKSQVTYWIQALLPSPQRWGGGWNVCIHSFCFLLHCISYTMQHTCINEAYLIRMWQELNTIHELYIQNNAFYSIKTLHTYIHIYTSKSKNVKVLSVCQYHALRAYKHFWHCALL
jgi:hypothetical protein